MHNQDSDLAKRVIEGDKNVNMMEVAIDEACVRIIAKRQRRRATCDWLW
ncbi:phosphate transport system regulatory protein PhoU [Escherichia coli]|uniref:Phosphate transport system regulatory protein PhoU n=1 Tax=Escherichia coli TaxID=562 RepID=A0A377B7B3_ECOLX|nr:phosphate transport system regulatory protein PhoU [Escherichia coli]